MIGRLVTHTKNQIDPYEASPGDVLDYIEPGGARSLRTHRVSGKRKGQVRVAPPRGPQRWVPMANVVACWRQRSRLASTEDTKHEEG